MKRYLFVLAVATMLNGCGGSQSTPLSFMFSSSQDPEKVWQDESLTEVLLSNGHHIRLEISNGLLEGEYSGDGLDQFSKPGAQSFKVDLSSIQLCGETANFQEKQDDDSLLEHSITSWPNHTSGVGCIVQDVLIKRGENQQTTEQSAELFFVHNGLVDRIDSYSWDDPFWELEQTKIRVLAPR
ncbi:hypothetical protein JCM19236_4105 [Vibrio sp. JCM 19236]|nr:hypothetical protein JCM19236_4105 [Vibrio sp. JCM 19236]